LGEGGGRGIEGRGVGGGRGGMARGGRVKHERNDRKETREGLEKGGEGREKKKPNDFY
jgi:hypothetical protein